MSPSFTLLSIVIISFARELVGLLTLSNSFGILGNNWSSRGLLWLSSKARVSWLMEEVSSLFTIIALLPLSMLRRRRTCPSEWPTCASRIGRPGTRRSLEPVSGWWSSRWWDRWPSWGKDKCSPWSRSLRNPAWRTWPSPCLHPWRQTRCRSCLRGRPKQIFLRAKPMMFLSLSICQVFQWG